MPTSNFLDYVGRRAKTGHANVSIYKWQYCVSVSEAWYWFEAVIWKGTHSPCHIQTLADVNFVDNDINLNPNKQKYLGL